jgi:hypothetical protein
MHNEQSAFAKRLRAALKDAGIEESPSALVKLLARYGANNVTPQAVSGWLSGRHLPRQANLRALAAIAGVEPHVLAYGGRGFKGVRDVPMSWPEAVRGHDRLAFEAYLALPEERRALVRELIAALAEVAARRAR